MSYFSLLPQDQQIEYLEVNDWSRYYSEGIYRFRQNNPNTHLSDSDNQHEIIHYFWPRLKKQNPVACRQSRNFGRNKNTELKDISRYAFIKN
jgi:hypothetical protein